METKSFTFSTEDMESLALAWIFKHHPLTLQQYKGNEIDPVTDDITFTFGSPEDSDAEDT